MVPIEKLSRDNFFSVVDVAKDIKDGMEMTPPEQSFVLIPLLQYRVKFQVLYPADGINFRDNYCDLRWNAVKYLKNNGYIEDFKILEGLHRWDNEIQVFYKTETFLPFYDNLLDVYKKRVSEPEKKNEVLESLTDEQVEKLHKILEILSIRLSMSHPPHIIYIPISQFPSDIQQFDLIGLLYKLDKELKVLDFSNIVGKDPLSQEFEVRFPKGKAEEFHALKREVDKKYKIVADNKRKEVPTTLEQKPIEVRLVEGSRVSFEKTEEKKKYEFPHKLPRGTKWENITIKFLDDDTVQILVQGKTHTTHYRDMGFDGKGSKPSVLWAFLCVLAKYSGEIKSTDPKAVEKYKKQKQSLSEKLEDYFGLYDPFYPFQMRGKTDKVYRVKFTILPPDNGFTFEKKEKISLLEKPVKKDPFADLGSYMGEVAPVVAQTETTTTDER